MSLETAGPTKPPIEGDLASSSVGKRHDLALGVERLGLISLRFPWLVAIVALALAIAAGFGVARLRVDDSLSQLFRSDTPEFRQYEEVTQQVSVERVRRSRRHRGRSGCCSAIRSTSCAISSPTFSSSMACRASSHCFRRASRRKAGTRRRRCFPETLPEGADYDALVNKVMSNEIIRGKLLSEDGKLALVVIALDPKIVGGKGLDAAVKDIRKTMADDLAGSGLKAELSGVPVMQLEIRTAVERDRLVYNVTGFIAGCLIAILFFRRVSFMIVAAGPPLLAILFALGALGWLDFRLNMFLNVMTPLIMVISFSDSMQLTFAARDRILAGQSKYEALRNAHPHRRARLRPDPCDGGAVLHRADVLDFGSDPHLRRGGPRRDADRALYRVAGAAAARRSPAAP